MSSSKQWIQKLSQFKKLQKTPSLNYTILKTLSQSLQQQPSIAKTEIFQSLLKSLPQQTQKLQLYSQLIQRIWRQQSYPIEVRQACCHKILYIVTQWIMDFELQSEKATSMSKKFALIKNFIIKHSTSMNMTILIVEEAFEDLKDFLDEQFWGQQEDQGQKDVKLKKNININNQDRDRPHEIMSLLQLLCFREVQIIYIKNSTSNEQYSDFDCYLSNLKYCTTKNYYDFVLNCINYLFSLELSQSQQCQGTKFALQFLKSLYCLQNEHIIIDLFKRLMSLTKKSVRFALVQQYMQVYRIFCSLQKYSIIQQLQQMVFFRQVIVGHSKVTQTITLDLEQQTSQQYYRNILVKAGSKQRVYFSMQDSECGMLKLQLILQQGMDINLRFYQFTMGNKETVYHEVLKTQLSKLHLKINFTGLYAIEFDNSYSWVSNKMIKYHLEILKKIDVKDIIQIKKEKY